MSIDPSLIDLYELINFSSYSEFVKYKLPIWQKEGNIVEKSEKSLYCYQKVQALVLQKVISVIKDEELFKVLLPLILSPDTENKVKYHKVYIYVEFI